MKSKQRADHEVMDREKGNNGEIMEWKHLGLKWQGETQDSDDMIERGVVENSYNQLVKILH